jgi:hypothetical protein
LKTTPPPELGASDLTGAAAYAAHAWQAQRLIFTDAHGRRILLSNVAGLARNGGYWYASHYDAASGRTLNVYVGTHRGSRKTGSPAAISYAGLLRASERIEAAAARTPRPVERCPCCGARRR